MKILLSWLFIFATFTGVISGGDDFCLKEMKSSGTSIQAAASHPHELPTSDCHHEGAACHTCHLGHCAFVVSSVPTALVGSVSEVSHPSYQSFLPSNPSVSLFRPPIA